MHKVKYAVMWEQKIHNGNIQPQVGMNGTSHDNIGDAIAWAEQCVNQTGYNWYIVKTIGVVEPVQPQFQYTAIIDKHEGK